MGVLLSLVTVTSDAKIFRTDDRLLINLFIFFTTDDSALHFPFLQVKYVR